MPPTSNGELSPRSKFSKFSMSAPRKNLVGRGQNIKQNGPQLQTQQDDSFQEEDAISPWTDLPPPTQTPSAPWGSDPQAHLAGTRPLNQGYFIDTAPRENLGSAFGNSRPDLTRVSTSESPRYDDEARRPSVVSATSAGSVASKEENQTGGRFHRKSLKALLGDDISNSGTRKGSVGSHQDGQQNGQDETDTHRNNSVHTARSTDERPKTPVPSSDVTPWDYQNFSDVSNFGSAPLRPELQAETNGGSNGSAPSGSKRGLLHRHTKSKDDAPKQSPPIPVPVPKRPSTSRDTPVSNPPFPKATQQDNTPMSSSSNLGRGSSPADRNEPEPQSEKRSLFSRIRHRNRDKSSSQGEQQKVVPPPEPVRPPTEIQRNRADSTKKDGVDPRDRETSVASVDSASTIKPPEPFPKIDRTFTASSKTSRFSRKNRGMSYQTDTGDKARVDKARSQTQQSQPPAGIFQLDTNLDDLSDIIATPSAAPGTEVSPWGSKGPIGTPSQELSAPVWDAPDSWAVKTDEEVDASPEANEDGLPAIEEEDGISYFMRVFRTDGSFATLSMPINASVSEVLQSLAKKSFLHDSIDKFHLLLRKNQLSRQLKPNERPIATQKKLLQQAGYQEQDHIDDVGREDNSYLCRFTFSHEKETGFGSGLENDPVFNKMQKFSHVDLSNRSLVTIPIVLYTRAPEIQNLNLSRNLALSVPKDFITACINLREIKFTGNEAQKLPPSLAWASRMIILDISNNRLEQLEHAELHRATSLVSLKLANNLLSELPMNYSHFRQLRSLNISSNSFKTFPEHLCNLKSLVDLDISFNKLSTLPTKMSQLKTLERLWMTNNEMKGPLPELFKGLVNLKEIDARFNAITNVDNVCELPNLEQLLVGHNSITTFKGCFKNLRNLVLDHCPITSFELEGSLPTLAFLNIASAKLVEFKDSIFEFLPNIQKLNLDKNHLSNLPSQIGRFTKLEFLSMAKNPLNLIPPSIGNLGELKFLNLRECNLKSLPPEVWYCKKLETLNLSSNVLENFPKQNAAPPPGPSYEELGKLEDFNEFAARRPSQASAGMMSTGSSPGGSQRKNSVASVHTPITRKMSQLSRTNTEFSMATRKDSNLSQARMQNTFAGSLRYLYLADNRLEDEIFRELVMLPELRMLNLSYNEIDDFPQGVLRRWPQMTELYLSGNSLTSLPSDDLEESSNLKTLHLNGNRFQVLPAELCNVHKLSTLDVGSNSLKYNVSNWPYDWNWNRNTNLKYLNFSANKRLEIKPASHPNQSQFNSMSTQQISDLTSFNTLKYLRVLGLMDVTLLTNTIPDDNEDRRVRTSASLAGALQYGMADTLGKNDHLSTLDLLKPNFRGHESEILVGMFDGQPMPATGSKVAKYLHENFSSMFIAELNKLDKTAKSGNTPIDALRRTFLSLNKDMANYANSNIDDKEHRLANGHRGSTVANSLSQDDLNTGGVATVLYLNGTELYVANVGDIEAILIQSNGQHQNLTTKHDPAEPRERERIRSAGGYVSRQGKLNDTLSISRAFGHFSHMPSIIAAPSTMQCQLSDSDELVVIASKEFWDFITVDLAVDVARADKGDLMLAAQKLRDLAMAFGARDRIMVMVLGVSDLRKRNNSRFRGTSLSMAKELGLDEGQIFPSSNRKRRKEGTLVGDSKLARLEEPDAPVGDVAICFTDIKNSTALWEILPVPMRSAIMMHNELMRRQLRIIGGYEVKTEGDAFMCSFPTATSALLWCFSCQSHLLELPWPTEILDTIHCQEKFDTDHNTIYRGLSVRMGIHWGHPVCDKDPITRRMDYFGPMVNKAARVSSVADGGQISASTDFVMEIQRVLEVNADDDRRDSVGSQDTAMNDDPLGDRIRRELRQLSSQGFEVKDLGERKLKGLENPEFIYLMYPHSLAGRLTVPPGGPEKPSVAAGEGAGDTTMAQPGVMMKDSELEHDGLQLEVIWKLWDVALRLEMLCSGFQNPEIDIGVRKPELSLLNRMKERGGVVSDAFLMNLMEHQVTRVEVGRLSLDE